jgi:cell division protein ZapE
VTLIATSNTPPDRLYEGGLQRQRFLPAIERIKRHCRVLRLDGNTDYRLRALERIEIYHHPLDDAARRNLRTCFREIAPEPGVPDAILEIHGRGIPSRRLADGVAWFDFAALCASPRSTADYSEIARCFHTVLLGEAPIMDAGADDAARRFIHLVDELYDRQVKLILSAEAPAESLYRGKRLAFEYHRTTSRLCEMASCEYLALPHLP